MTTLINYIRHVLIGAILVAMTSVAFADSSIVNLSMGISPATLPQDGTAHAVTITFQNQNSSPITLDYINGNWPVGFSHIQDTCSGSMLAGKGDSQGNLSDSCTITGQYIASTANVATWTAQVNAAGYTWKKEYSQSITLLSGAMVDTIISGLPASATVPITMTSGTNVYGPFNQTNGTQNFANMNDGIYTVAAADYTDPTTSHVYQANLNNPYTITHSNRAVPIVYQDKGIANIPLQILITGNITQSSGAEPIMVTLNANAGNAIAVDGQPHLWGAVAAGQYVAGPSSVTVGGIQYNLSNTNFTITNATTQINLQYNQASSPNLNVNTNISGLPSDATVAISMTDGTHSYGPKVQTTGSALFAAMAPGSYVVTAPNYTDQSGDIYEPVLSNPYTIDSTHTLISIPYQGQMINAKVKIMGDLASVPSASIPLILTNGANNYGPISILANGSAQNFASISAGSYSVISPLSLNEGTETYVLKSTGPYSLNNTIDTITLEYDKLTSGNGIVNFTLTNDRTLRGHFANIAQSLVFTNTSTHTTITETVPVNSGHAEAVYQMPAGVYQVSLTSPDGYNAVLSDATGLVVQGGQTTNLFADYKYSGSYVYLNQTNYNLMLSTKDNDIKLGQGSLAGYQCYYRAISTAPYYEHYNCQNGGDFYFPTTLRTIHNEEGNDISISEDKLWAMSTALAAIIERTEVEYGHHPFDGMPNNFPSYHNDQPLYGANDILVVQNGTFATLGDYLYENISPNYLLSRCLQEGNKACRITVGNAPSGVFQIDSFPTVLSYGNYGGYGVPFSLLQKSYVITTPGGPFNTDANHDMSNYVGGVISSAFFDSTNYSPQWATDNAVQLKQILGETSQSDVIEYLSSIFYNQGPNALSSAFFNSANTDYCASTNFASQQKDIRFDPRCFLQAGTGGLYPFQLPDINHNYLEQAPTKLTNGSFYNTTLTWDEISAFLDLIGPSYYGFYDDYDIKQAKIAAKKAFLQEAGAGTSIDFRSQFPAVRDAILQSLPVYLTGVNPPGAGVVLNNASSNEFFLQSTTNNFDINAGNKLNMEYNTTINTFKYASSGWVNCSSTVQQMLNDALKDTTVYQINLNVGTDGACTLDIQRDTNKI